jgi:ankyrin repeat protein
MGHFDSDEVSLSRRSDLSPVHAYRILPSSSTHGPTALHKPAAKGHIDIVNMLLKAGADVNAKDEVSDSCV